MTTVATWTLVGALMAASGPAWAEEESEKVRKARAENELEKSAESTDAACGTHLAVRIDWAGFDADPAWRKNSVSSYCDGPLDELRRLCEGPATKAFVAKAVKTLVCQAVKTKAEWSLVVKGSELLWRVPPDAVNATDFAHQELLKRL